MSLLSKLRDIRNKNNTRTESKKQRLVTQDEQMMFLCTEITNDGLARHEPSDPEKQNTSHDYMIYAYLNKLRSVYQEIMPIVHNYDDDLLHVSFRCLCGSLYLVLFNKWLSESISDQRFEGREGFISVLGLIMIYIRDVDINGYELPWEHSTLTKDTLPRNETLTPENSTTMISVINGIAAIHKAKHQEGFDLGKHVADILCQAFAANYNFFSRSRYKDLIRSTDTPWIEQKIRILRPTTASIDLHALVDIHAKEPCESLIISTKLRTIRDILGDKLHREITTEWAQQLRVLMLLLRTKTHVNDTNSEDYSRFLAIVNTAVDEMRKWASYSAERESNILTNTLMLGDTCYLPTRRRKDSISYDDEEQSSPAPKHEAKYWIFDIDTYPFGYPEHVPATLEQYITYYEMTEMEKTKPEHSQFIISSYIPILSSSYITNSRIGNSKYHFIAEYCYVENHTSRDFKRFSRSNVKDPLVRDKKGNFWTIGYHKALPNTVTWLYLGKLPGNEKKPQEEWQHHHFGKWLFRAPISKDEKHIGCWELVEGPNNTFGTNPLMLDRNREYFEQRNAMQWYEECLAQQHMDDSYVTVSAGYQGVNIQKEIDPNTIYYARE